jgi:predicted NBD/HSP70 family sugar kinase
MAEQRKVLYYTTDLKDQPVHHDNPSCSVGGKIRIIDPSAYFVGGGVVEASPKFREWFLARVREHTSLREEQLHVTTFALIPDLDMAGARGAALAAFDSVDAL